MKIGLHVEAATPRPGTNKPFDAFVKGLKVFSSRSSHADVERVPLEFLAWFLEHSLQRDVIAELMDDWVAGTLDDGPFEAHA